MKNINKFLKKFKNVRVIALVLVSVFVIAGVGFAFAENIGGIADIFEKTTEEEAEKVRPPATLLEKEPLIIDAGRKASTDAKTLEAEQQAELEAAMDLVGLSDNFTEKIRGRSNFDKAVRGIKTIITEKRLDETQQAKLEEYAIVNTDSTAFYTLYDYLFDNFFTFADLDGAIARYNGGESMDAILQSFCDIEDSFVARDYPEGMIEHYTDNLKISISELAVSEIMDFRGVIAFEAIIERLAAGETMADVCDDLGVINRNVNISTVDINEAVVEQAAKDLGISEDEAFKKVVSAKKAKVRDNDIMGFLKSRGSAGSKIREHYQAKFDKGGLAR